MMESKLSQSRWTALFWIFPVLFPGFFRDGSEDAVPDG